MKKHITLIFTVLATQIALFAQTDCSEEMVWDLFYSITNSDVVDLPEGAEASFTVNDEPVDGVEGVFEIFAADIFADNTLCIEFTSDDCPDPIITCQTGSLVDLMFGDIDEGDDWGDDWDDDWGDDWNDSTDGDWDDWGDDWDDWSDSTEGDWDDWGDDWDGDWDDWGDDWDGDWDDWDGDWDDWGDDWDGDWDDWGDDWDGDWDDWSDSTDGDWDDWGDDWDDWGDDWDDWSDSIDGDWDDWGDDWDDWGDDWDDWSDSTDGDWDDWGDDWDGDWDDWGDDWDDWSDSTDGDWDDWGDDWDGDWDDNNDEDDYDGEGQGEVSSIESINSEINISLYPVPARDNLTVEGLPEGNWEAMIFDSYGRLVSNQIISNLQMVDLNTINNGYYSIHIVGLYHSTKRFIIQK